MTLSFPTRMLRRALVCLALGALTPLAVAQRGGGGGGGSRGGGGAQPMDSGGQMGGGQMGGGQRGGPTPGMQPGGNGPGGNNAPGGGNFGGPMGAIRSAPMVAIPGRFWNDNNVVHSLRLRPEQQRRMDAIFEANRGPLMSLYTNLQREESKLSAMSPKNMQDQTKVFSAIDRVAQARADLEKQKLQMVQALRKEMDAEQWSQLEQMSASH